MMRLNCHEAREDIDAYAIGALDVAEADALEGHIEGCPECAALVDEAHGVATTAMSLAAPLVSSSQALKARVMASAAVLRELPRQGPLHRRRWYAAVAALAIAAVVAWALVLQVRVGSLDQRNATLRRDATVQSGELATERAGLRQASDVSTSITEAVAMQGAIVDLLTEPDVQRTPLLGTIAGPKAQGDYLWSATRDAGVLVTSSLPPLASDQTYEMWVVYPGEHWTRAGSFTPDAFGTGRLIVRTVSDDDPPDAAPAWFCVTVEPAGGAPSNRGTMVLTSARK
jgi:anti-sigma-K factor RskA